MAIKRCEKNAARPSINLTNYCINQGGEHTPIAYNYLLLGKLGTDWVLIEEQNEPQIKDLQQDLVPLYIEMRSKLNFHKKMAKDGSKKNLETAKKSSKCEGISLYSLFR
jgi:hypothetical protein